MKQLITNAVQSREITERETRHRELSRRIAAESIVLLQNDGTLPLASGSVALLGAGAAATIKGGTGSGEVNERTSVTIRQGLENAGFDILTKDYLDKYEEILKAAQEKYNKKFTRKMIFGGFRDIVNLMSDQFMYPPGSPLTEEYLQNINAGVGIYVIARQAGECADRKLADYRLYESEINDIRLVSKHCEKTIVIINAGSQIDTGALDSLNINAILYFCQQGMEGGNALADVLTGSMTPCGCLTSTWPVKYEDWPNAMDYSYLKGHSDFDEYKEGIYVGYRYFDSFGIQPRYPFGYGLSYTQFKLETTDVSAAGADIAAIVNVTNTGKRPGKKIVQAYVSAPAGAYAREYQSLAAFGKTGILDPGRSQALTLTFSLTDLAVYDEQSACFMLGKGDYILRVGSDSAKTDAVAVINLDETVVTEKCANVCQPAAAIREISPGKSPNPVAENKPGRIVYVKSSDIATLTHDYTLPAPHIDEKTAGILKQLTPLDMLTVVNGSGMFSDGPETFSVPGAAGNTTSALSHLGVPNAALCDGPAGIRIQQHFVQLKNGKTKSVDAPVGILAGLPGFIKRFMFADPSKGASYYQYASAFPVGTALAQTWDTGLMEAFGDAIGTEAEEFGCTFWLAPGMNIQRNPLCGRNFEYYSEDPLLTGKTAAAVTRGVQKHEGCYVTIKHYAANNQENNRNKSDSRLSERALREIYLKGFRIAVQEGGAKSVMTSYNKLNGTYTPNSYDLCTKLLRCEWGFDGVVMTDWFSTGKGLAGNAKAIEAGNDLIMPGGKEPAKDFEKSHKNGSLSIDALETSCGRVLMAVLNGRTGIELSKKQKK